MDLKELEYKIHSEVRTRHPWELARFQIACDIIEKHIGKENLKVIFDIGCGDTFFLESISLRYPGCQYYGVDMALSEEVIAYKSFMLKSKNIFLFKEIDLALSHCGQELSLILLMDVLEHISDDSAFLKMLKEKEMITHQTSILITVPSYQSLFCQHDIFLVHYRRYNNLELKNLLNVSGYTLDKIGYFFLLLIIPRIVQVLKEKIFPPKKCITTGLSRWNGGEFKSKLLKRILILDYKFSKLFDNKVPGLSNFVVCRKSV